MYEKGRAEVCTRLLTEVLDHDFQQTTWQSQETSLGPSLRRVKNWSMNWPMRLSFVPSVDPFHLLYYMGQNPMANTYLLARVCRALAVDALKRCRELFSKAGLASSKQLPDSPGGCWRDGGWGLRACGWWGSTARRWQQKGTQAAGDGGAEASSGYEGGGARVW